MLIFSRPDCMLNVKPNCNGIVQHLRKAICCSKKRNSFLMLGGVSDHQDLSSTYHGMGQPSAVLRVHNGTGLSVRKLWSGLGFVTDTFNWHSVSLRGTMTRWSSTASPGLHWIETCTTCQTGMCFPTLSRLLEVRQGCVSKSDTFTECVCDPSIFFPLFQLPEIVSNDVATTFRPPGSLSHSLEESDLEELLSFRAFHESKK